MHLRKVNFVPLTPFLINLLIILYILLGKHGVLAILQQKNMHVSYGLEYNLLKKENDIKYAKLMLINEDIIDMRYLNEVLRTKYSMILPEEKVVLLNEDTT